MDDAPTQGPPAATQTVFLEAGRSLVALLDDPAVAATWDTPSVLAAWSVGGLAAHATRALLTVQRYLDAPRPSAGSQPVDAAGYVLAVLPDDHLDPDDELHRGIRARGDDAAAAGPAQVVATARAALDELARRLEDVPGTTPLAVLDGVVTTIDEYLVTRVVELVVHLDDLAVGLDVANPAPPAAVRVATDALVEIARRRRGDLGLLRAVARRERVDGPVAL